MTIEEFNETLRQDLYAKAGANGNYTRSTFTEHMCSIIEDQGNISDFNLVDYKYTPKGLAVDAWARNDEIGTLYLFITDFRESAEIESLTNTEINAAFSRLAKFFEAAQKQSFAESLEESAPVTELAWSIAKAHIKFERITMILLSNARISARVGNRKEEKICGIPTTYEIWDLERIHQLHTSGQERESIEVDLTAEGKKGLPCLPAFAEEGEIKSYLMVIPGQVLASLYKDFGERLFEQNVRTFLQFRGHVNKGIRATLISSPQMFFSYNNGISATAEEVVTSKSNDRILSIKNLQIVNGGQTTASIFTAMHKEHVDLSKVHVQMKLSVVPRAQVENIVPKISEYANTQNKVSAADFFSNHPFHLRLEELSRRLWAPATDGSVKQTHWFYERTRGQYANAQANMSTAEMRVFLTQNPTSQMFAKTDLAKFILTFEELPHIVSLGAQKSFSGTPKSPGFVAHIAQQWEKDSNSINELWFKRAIAKGILFRNLDRLILKQPWYTGYKANIVTYTLAKFSAMARKAGKSIDFIKIWQAQAIPTALEEELLSLAEVIAKSLLSPPPGTTSNVSEWAKYTMCWESISNMRIGLSDKTKTYLCDLSEAIQEERSAGKQQAILVGIEAQTYVINKGASYWMQLLSWNEANKKLSPNEMSLIELATNPRKVPSEKQVQVILNAEKRAKAEGFSAN